MFTMKRAAARLGSKGFLPSGKDLSMELASLTSLQRPDRRQSHNNPNPYPPTPTPVVRRVPRRAFGGYIEESNLVQMGVEIYQDLHGPDARVPPAYIVPQSDDWPSNLWDYELGVAVSAANDCKGTAGWHRPSWTKNAQTIVGRSNSLVADLNPNSNPDPSVPSKTP